MKQFLPPLFVAVLLTATQALTLTAQRVPTFVPTATYQAGGFDESAAEIVAYDKATKRAYLTSAQANSVVALQLTPAGGLDSLFTIDLTPYGGGVNSVAVANGRVAIAVQADVSTDPGALVMFDTDGQYQTRYTVGALPDAVKFSPDGNTIAVANEGEPNDAYTVDPEGSISLVDVRTGTVRTADFQAYIGREDELRARGIRIFGPSANAAQDLEPEYLAFSPDGKTVYVTLQENNAFAIVDVASGTVRDVTPLGYKDWSAPGYLGSQGFDASNRTDDIRIWSHKVLGMYQPDAITSFLGSDGQTYLVTANEGDARDYDGYSEEVRVASLRLDRGAYPSDYTKSNESLGRLLSTTATGDTDGDGDVDQIYSFGARSFSVWDADGKLVWDSADDFEKTLRGLVPEYFNSNNDDNDSRKSRSDDKGPEPEAIEIGRLNGKTVALIGLERQSGVMVYDLSNPRAPQYLTYFSNRRFEEEAALGSGGDLGPEEIVWIDGADSPTGAPVVLISNEVSGTLTAYEVLGEDERYTLQILHNNDGESELLQDPNVDVGGIAAFAQVVDSLRYTGYLAGANSILLSSGDNFLPGPAFSAGLVNAEIYDAIALQRLRYDALAIGNHDFDFGPSVLASFVREATVGTETKFLSANLDFAAEPELQALVGAGKIAPSTILYRGTEGIGVIGLTTPDIRFISSPGRVAINTMLAEAVNAEVAKLKTRGINKFVLISHLQSIAEDTALIPQLNDIDIVIAGGGDELLSNNPNDTLPGTKINGPYPLRVRDAAGRTVHVVTTPGSYRYVGQLFATFDRAGEIVEIGEASGPVKVKTALPEPNFVADVEQPVRAYVAGLNQRVIGRTEVALDGVRGNIRTRETNQGNLVADALLFQARELATSFGVSRPQIALQNGGGIRNDATIAAGSQLTELTTFDILPFANFVSVAEDVTAAQLKVLLENAVSRVESGNGRFAQVAGLKFEYDVTGTAQVIGATNQVTTAGTRVRKVTLDDGTVVVDNGAVVTAGATYSVATINFLAGGGDQYLFDADFTNLGVTYQQALANYIRGPLNGLVTAAQYPSGGEGRIRRVGGGDTFTGLTPKPGTASLFPNPSRGAVQLAGEQAEAGQRTVRVLNVAGHEVQRYTTAATAGGYRMDLDLRLAAGLYLLEVNTPGATETHALVIE